jgi:hypothetical protein
MSSPSRQERCGGKALAVLEWSLAAERPLTLKSGRLPIADTHVVVSCPANPTVTARILTILLAAE